MKNLVWLICVFSVMFSCKQTKLTQNFKRVSNNIYVQHTIKKHFKDVALDEMKSNYYSKTKAINKMDINPLNCNQMVKKEEFYADTKSPDPVLISNANKYYQNLISIDSIIKSQNNPTKEEDEEILKLSRKAKNFNLIGLLIGLVSLVSFENLAGLLLYSGVLSLIGLFYLLNTKRKIKKNVEYQNMAKSVKDKVKKNILISKIISLIIFLPLVVLAGVAILFYVFW